MENHSEEEKFANIRQTIRRVILPLIQEIYKEDPTDIILFCSGYFDGLLHKRESNEENSDNRNSKMFAEISHKDEEGETVSTSEVRELMDIPLSNIQGSASEPVLTSERHCEGICLRETSSWNLGSNHSFSDRPSAVLDCNLADAMSRIGDQPRQKVEQTENLENDAKAGDVNINQKEEEKVFENDSQVENGVPSQVMFEPIPTEEQNIYAFASAPLYENLDQNFEETSSEEKKSENSKIHEDSFSSVSGLRSAAREEIKTCNKRLPLNSSFGFIPHLNERDSEAELKRVDSECYESSKRKINEEIQELAKKLSETFQSLAQEFSSAESKFDEEFQNAKEISDVIQGQRETKEINDCSKLTQDSHKHNETTNRRRETDENSNFDETNLKQVQDVDNNLENTINSPDFEPKFEKSPDKFLRMSSDLETTDGSKSENKFSYQKDTYNIGHETIRDFSKPEYDEVQNLNPHQLSKEQRNSTLLQDSKSDNKFDNHEYRQTVDEEWRRRWYEAHPRLDNISERDPRFFRGYRVFNGIRSNETIHNIGEAGDVPPDRFFTAEETLNERLGYSLESNNAVTTSSTVGENISYGNLSADENRHRIYTGRVIRNFSDRDQTNTSAPNIYSQNIPYSWRYRRDPQVCSLENEGKSFQNFQKKTDVETPDSERDVKKDLNANIIESDEILSEVVVVKQEEEEAKTYSLNECQNMSSIKMEENKEETKIHEESKSYKENITRNSKSLSYENVNNDETKMKSSWIDNECHLQQKDYVCEHPENGGNENYFKLQQAVDNDNCKKGKLEMTNRYVSCSEINKTISESQRNESPTKVEPGLNSAGGDFIPFNQPPTNEINEQNFNLQTSNEATEENSGNIREQNPANLEDTTADDFEEVLGKAIEEHVFVDSFETLNFSSYSESDKSSDYSETDLA